MAKTLTTVALDGFGVERGFDVLAEGVRMAAGDGVRVRVFGPASEIDLEGVPGAELIPTERAITNEDDPVTAVRSQPEASVVRAVADVKEGHSEAVVSAGSTGALMAAATFGLRRLKGVKRPALAVQLPLPGKPILFLDVGANAEARAQHLVQFAYLGASYAGSVLGNRDPSVGLLSVGEEAGKGREEVVEANATLKGSEGIRFIGNVEGRDIPLGTADVVVTDGFTGNVSLKLLEGTAKVVGQAIGDAARGNPVSALGGLMMKPAIGGLKKSLHPDTTGGAILLGLNAVAVVAHGSSGAEGVANAIRLAARCAEVDAPRRTEEALHAAGVNRGAMAPGARS